MNDLVSVAVFVGYVFIPLVVSLDNGLARTPPMGWMKWERFRCNIDCKNYPNNCIGEKLIMDTADRMAADGFRDAGYKYVSIDNCWMSEERDAQGRLQADPERFPRGIKFLADYIHKKGLLLAIYEDLGSNLCGGYPGSEFYQSTDAQTFADWGVDMLRLDGCDSDSGDMLTGYAAMGSFLNKTGRPILYSCNLVGPSRSAKEVDYKQIAKICNLWRNYDDIRDSWDSVHSIIRYYGKDANKFSSVAGPGNWNDPDQLIIGDFGLSWEQQKVQMGMWAIMASPLFMSVDLRTIQPQSRNLLLNRRVLAINQDPLGIQGVRLYTYGHTEVWRRQLQKGSYAIALLNADTGGAPTRISMRIQDIGISSAGVDSYIVTETFNGTPLGTFKPNGILTIAMNPTGIFLATVVPVSS